MDKYRQVRLTDPDVDRDLGRVAIVLAEGMPAHLYAAGHGSNYQLMLVPKAAVTYVGQMPGGISPYPGPDLVLPGAGNPLPTDGVYLADVVARVSPYPDGDFTFVCGGAGGEGQGYWFACSAYHTAGHCKAKLALRSWPCAFVVAGLLNRIERARGLAQPGDALELWEWREASRLGLADRAFRGWLPEHLETFEPPADEQAQLERDLAEVGADV